MTSEQLQKWSLTAEIFGGLAVVVTLIILIVEVRGNTEALQLQEVRSARDAVGRITEFHIDYPEIYAKSLFEPENLDRNELIQVSNMMLKQRQVLQNMHDAYESRIIDYQEWQVWKDTAPAFFGHPLGRVYWEEEKKYLRETQADSFIREIDEAMESSGVGGDDAWFTEFFESVDEAFK